MEMQSNSMTERRRFQRVDSNVPVKYRNLRTTTVSTGSMTKNVGEGGISFNTNEFISLACRLVVEVILPTVPKPIKAISKVAWIRKTSSGEQYELGNQFLEITKEDRALITDYVSRMSSPNP